jgi:diketogulonate reductase-like aldo/keto reductase
MTQQQDNTATHEEEQDSFNLMDWIKAPPVSFQVESEYHAHIEALMTEVTDLCSEHGIPMFAHFELGTKEGDGSRATKALNLFNAGGDIGRMSKLLMGHLLVSNGDWKAVANMPKHSAVRELMASKKAIKLELDDEDKELIKKALGVLLKGLRPEDEHHEPAC